MATISYRRLSDATLSKYREIVESGGELTDRQRANLLSHLRLLATFEGERSDLLREHNAYASLSKAAKQSDIDNSRVPWTVIALSRRIPPLADIAPPPPAAAVNFRPKEGRDGE